MTNRIIDLITDLVKRFKPSKQQGHFLLLNLFYSGNNMCCCFSTDISHQLLLNREGVPTEELKVSKTCSRVKQFK